MSGLNLNQAEIERLSMVDLANLIFNGEQRPMSFKEAFDQIAALKNWDETEKQGKIAQFYTDLNIDGRFVTNGSNSWGLKRWYRSDQIKEDLSMDDLEDMIEDDIEDELEDEDGNEINSLDDEDYDDYDDEGTDMEDDSDTIDDADFKDEFDEEYEDDFEDTPV